MPAIVLIGAQWGDEARGRYTDLLVGAVDDVVRYQGGNNAGHTVASPTGIALLLLALRHPVTRMSLRAIGNGAWSTRWSCSTELYGLDDRGIDTSNLPISASPI